MKNKKGERAQDRAPSNRPLVGTMGDAGQGGRRISSNSSTRDPFEDLPPEYSKDPQESGLH